MSKIVQPPVAPRVLMELRIRLLENPEGGQPLTQVDLSANLQNNPLACYRLMHNGAEVMELALKQQQERAVRAAEADELPILLGQPKKNGVG